jgi:amino acid transporter
MKCLNWKVIGALAAVGVGIYVVAPGVAAAAVPLLVLAVCPLSMLLMMRAMGSMGRCDSGDAGGAKADPDEVARLRAEVAALRAERQEQER